MFSKLSEILYTLAFHSTVQMMVYLSTSIHGILTFYIIIDLGLCSNGRSKNVFLLWVLSVWSVRLSYWEMKWRGEITERYFYQTLSIYVTTLFPFIESLSCRTLRKLYKVEYLNIKKMSFFIPYTTSKGFTFVRFFDLNENKNSSLNCT